jgi:hypothetical protein
MKTVRVLVILEKYPFVCNDEINDLKVLYKKLTDLIVLDISTNLKDEIIIWIL